MAKLADAIHFDYIEELCDEILDKFDCDEDIQVSVIGKYKEMKAFLKEFMKYDNVDFDCIELHDPECNKYDKEYIVDIIEVEPEILSTSIEKIRKNEEILKFVVPESNMKILYLS